MCLSRGPLNWEIKPRNFAESLHCLSAAARLTTLSLGDGGLETASEVGSSAPGDLETWWTNVEDGRVGERNSPELFSRKAAYVTYTGFVPPSSGSICEIDGGARVEAGRGLFVGTSFHCLFT